MNGDQKRLEIDCLAWIMKSSVNRLWREHSDGELEWSKGLSTWGAVLSFEARLTFDDCLRPFR